MRLAKASWILTLIGGILSFLVGVILIITYLVQTDPAAKLFGIFQFGIGVWLAFFSVIIVISSFLIKKKKTRLIGSILALIFSVVGGGNMISIIGAIFGFISLKEE